MKTSITHAPARGSTRVTWPGAVSLALALTCLLTALPLRAEGAHRGGHQHSQERGVRQQGYRHEDRRRSNGYGGDEDYVYGAPPIVYAPEAAPGVNLFLPL